MRHFLLVSVACLLCISLAGCPLGVGPVKVTVGAYEKIKVGMTMQEVEVVMGRPGLAIDRRGTPEKEQNIPVDAKWLRWQHERTSYPKYIAVAFIDDKVVAKELVGFSEAGKGKAVEKQEKKE